MRRAMTRATLIFLVLASIGAAACDPPEVASTAHDEGEAYVPLRDDTPEVRASFVRARQALASLAVVELAVVTELAEGMNTGTGPSAVHLEEAADIRAAALAGETGLDERLVIRLPTGELCGQGVGAPSRRVCIETTFVAPEMEAGEVWEMALVPHGPPNTGTWAVLAGRPIPSTVDPDVALAQTRDYVDRGAR
jgi:hypothetical protein